MPCSLRGSAAPGPGRIRDFCHGLLRGPEPRKDPPISSSTLTSTAARTINRHPPLRRTGFSDPPTGAGSDLGVHGRDPAPTGMYRVSDSRSQARPGPPRTRRDNRQPAGISDHPHGRYARADNPIGSTEVDQFVKSLPHARITLPETHVAVRAGDRLRARLTRAHLLVATTTTGRFRARADDPLARVTPDPSLTWPPRAPMTREAAPTHRRRTRPFRARADNPFSRFAASRNRWSFPRARG